MNPNRERSRSREKVGIYRQDPPQLKKSEERQMQRAQSNQRKNERKSPSAQRQFNQGYMQYPSSNQPYTLPRETFVQGPMGGQNQGMVQPGMSQVYGQGVKPNTVMSQGLGKTQQLQQSVAGQGYYGVPAVNQGYFPVITPPSTTPKPLTKPTPSPKPQPLTLSQLKPQTIQQLATFLRHSKKPFPSHQSPHLLTLLQKLSVKYPFQTIYQVFLYFFIHCSVLDEGVYKVFYWLVARREEDMARFYDVLVRTTVKSAFEEWKAVGLNVIVNNAIELASYYKIQSQTRQTIMNRPLYSHDKDTGSMTTVRNVLTLVRKAMEREKISQKGNEGSHPIRQILKVVRQVTKSTLKRYFLNQPQTKQPTQSQQQHTLHLILITQLYLSIYPKYKHHAIIQLQQTLNELTILKMKLSQKQSEPQSDRLEEQHKVQYLYLMWVVGLAVYGRGLGERWDMSMLEGFVGVMIDEYAKSGEFLVEKIDENQGKMDRRQYFARVRKNFGALEDKEQEKVVGGYRQLVYGIWREVVCGVLLMELRGNSHTDDKLNTTSPNNNNNNNTNNNNNNTNNNNNNKKPPISWLQTLTCLHPISTSCHHITNHLSLKTKTSQLLLRLNSNSPSQQQQSKQHQKLTISNHVVLEFDLLYEKSCEELCRMLSEEKARVGQRQWGKVGWEGSGGNGSKGSKASREWSEAGRVRVERWVQRLRQITGDDTSTFNKLLLITYLNIKLNKFSTINNTASPIYYPTIQALNSTQLQLISHLTSQSNINMLADVINVVKSRNEGLLMKTAVLAEVYEWEQEQARVLEKVVSGVGRGEGEGREQREGSCGGVIIVGGNEMMMIKQIITQLITNIQSYIQTSNILANEHHQTSIIHHSLYTKKLSLLHSSIITHLQQFILQIKSCHQTNPILAQTLIEMLLLEIFRLYVGMGEEKAEKRQLNLIEGTVRAMVRGKMGLGINGGDRSQERKEYIGRVEGLFGQLLEVIYNMFVQIDMVQQSQQIQSQQNSKAQHNPTTPHPTPLIQLLITKLKKCISLHYDKLNELSLTTFILNQNLFILRCLVITFYKIKSLTEILCDGFGLFQEPTLKNQRDGDVVELARKVFFMVKGDRMLEAVVKAIKNRDKSQLRSGLLGLGDKGQGSLGFNQVQALISMM